eukprot:scaffold1903_cov396-Prasinococcus_capsulatus_cf.AAC.18
MPATVPQRFVLQRRFESRLRTQLTRVRYCMHVGAQAHLHIQGRDNGFVERVTHYDTEGGTATLICDGHMVNFVDPQAIVTRSTCWSVPAASSIQGWPLQLGHRIEMWRG